MTREELERQFMNLDLPEGAARICAGNEEKDKKIAWLAGYHFMYGLNKRLRFYDDTYAELLREEKIKTPESMALLEAGALPEQIADFAYQVALEAYCHVLHQLSDFEAEYGKEDLPTWKLVEKSADGELTGRIVTELQELIPY